MKKKIIPFDPKKLKYKRLFCRIKKSHSNLFITITDFKGNVFYSMTTGKMYPTRKNMRFKCNTTSSTLLGKEVGSFLQRNNVKEIDIIFKYPLKDSFIKNIVKGIVSSKISVVNFFDFTIRAHNGCKTKKCKRK